MIEAQYNSFRDPAARVVRKGNVFYRYIFNSYRNEYEHLMNSGLYKELTTKNWMIKHVETENDNAASDIFKLLLPEQIPFQSYPYEWSFLQWKKAVIAFLNINLIALKYGMILKDATPYNFYFKQGKATLFDTSSFVFFKDNDQWLAYRQFCEEFLSPMALMKYNGQAWSKILISHLRGFPLDFVSKQLSIKSLFNSTCLLHIHFHSRFNNKKVSNSNKKIIAGINKQMQHNGFTREKLKHLQMSIKSDISKWKHSFSFSHHWQNYYELGIESPVYLADKEEVLDEWIKAAKPLSVIDLGANTGKFSIIASQYASKVIALEYDDICVDNIELEISKKKLNNIYTLMGDLSQLSTDTGVLNKEYQTIITRGKSEMVLGLAIVHHLCIANNISLKQVAELFASFSSKFIIVEFIPKDDAKVQILLESREDIFIDYNEINFENAFSTYFEIKKVHTCKDSLRKLYFGEKR